MRRNIGISLLTWGLTVCILGPFLIKPVCSLFAGALIQDHHLNLALLWLPLQNPLERQAVINSLVIACCTTLLASLIALPLAYCTARLQFAGKNWLTGLLLVPLLLPPLVGAVGLRQLLAREGTVNTLLQQAHLTRHSIDFLQMAAPMVVVVAALHLFPLVFLNVSAAWANVDPGLEEAAENLGAHGARLMRTVTLPLLLPGYLAGALIVWIFAFTDLGTPLVFNFKQVTAVRIFDLKADPTDPRGYLLALWVTVLAGAIFFASRTLLGRRQIATLARGTRRSREQAARPWQSVVIYLGFAVVLGIALLPHVGVVMASLAHDWTSTLLPQWSLENYTRLLGGRDGLSHMAANSINISLLCAGLAMVLDVVLGTLLAYALIRGRVWAAALLDTLAMLPLALPGIVLAFGLLMSYRDTPLDAISGPYGPLPLLVISYAVRRLPYALRAVSGGLQQMSVTLEEASLNLGATPLATIWNVTRPLVAANLFAAALLTFAFAVMEVSDSLILAANSEYRPIANAIYQLTIALSGGMFLACALGVIGMVLLIVIFLVTNRLLGRSLGAVFRM